MFRIKRPQLLAEIWELSKSGSVVLTGSPGVGKSWMIAQLVRQCRAENRPYLPIAAEDFDIRSIDELGVGSQFKTDILSFLKALGTGPVLSDRRARCIARRAVSTGVQGTDSPRFSRGVELLGDRIDPNL